MKSLVAAILALGLVGGAAQAATVFADDFEVIGKGQKKNFNNFPNFTVSDGSVDYIRTGTYQLSCAGGTGGCVDLDGSTGKAGVMTSSLFAIEAGSSYTISFDLSGNGRGQKREGARGVDAVSFGITGGLFSGSIGDIAWDQGFNTYSYTFEAATSGMFAFYIGAAGGDYYAPLLDNVLITSAAPADVPAVPLPATLPLLAGAIGAAALWRRKRA
ncbi:hypothetical protein [Paenirhodobacter sp.]|uniref:hypothetical protein n=1 Tax=Paenirhodobacter sp. TaxID=1965326 RepID=UPI003B3EC50B